MGAAGRDFHNFISCFKDRPHYEVIGFTAAQIPRIADRLFPAELAGDLYPDGIPIFPEEQLPELIRRHQVDLVVFSYSDVAYAEVMHKAAIVGAAGANFILLGPQRTMLSSRQPVVAVCGVRTGCGKSPTTRKVCEILARNNRKAVVVRHPMPYGDLKEEVVQRFGSAKDFKTYRCTIEELEEYEPLVEQGIVVYAGVDYCRILQAAEAEADVIVWDGGNNDTPFYRPDLHIVLFDPLRPGHELLYYPGETNMRLADIAIINKVASARPQDVARVRANIERHAPAAAIVLADSHLLVKEPERITGPHIGTVLPAMGYGEEQIRELERTINTTRCDLVLFATPIHLARLLDIEHPSLRIRYEYRDHGEPVLEEVLVKRLQQIATPKTCRRDAACKEPLE
ncbi:MAG: GTPase [Deltaproteobacteria bacterium]